jgi:hypothetical protein
MMRTGRRVKDGSFREQVAHMVPQFGSGTQDEGDDPIEATPDVRPSGRPHMNQFLFDASSRLAAISLAAAISKSSSDC